MQVGLLGHEGRMGRILQAEIKSRGWQVIPLSFVKDELKKEVVKCDVVIEFSSQVGVNLLLDVACLPLVLASTGLNEDVLVKIKAKSLDMPIFYSSNYSRGLFKLLKLLKASGLNHDGARIIEMHHVHKKDAPSGTALMMQSFLEIPSGIESIREGEVFGEHEVVYSLYGEELSFSHKALGREVFARGACDAAAFIIKQTQGLFSMEDLEFFN